MPRSPTRRTRPTTRIDGPGISVRRRPVRTRTSRRARTISRPGAGSRWARRCSRLPARAVELTRDPHRVEPNGTGRRPGELPRRSVRGAEQLLATPRAIHWRVPARTGGVPARADRRRTRLWERCARRCSWMPRGSSNHSTRDLARGAYLSAYSSAFVAAHLPGLASSSRSAAPRKTSLERRNAGTPGPPARGSQSDPHGRPRYRDPHPPDARRTG